MTLREAEPAHRVRIPAAARLLGTVGFAVAVVLLPATAHVALAAAAVIVAIGWIAVRVPFAAAAARLLPLELLLAGFGLAALARPELREAFLLAAVKSHLCLGAILVLTQSTPATELLAALRRLGCPPLIADTLALMWRYLPLVLEESRRLQRARSSRSFAPGRRLPWGALGGIVALLFVRCIGRAERIYLAMCARGWK